MAEQTLLNGPSAESIATTVHPRPADGTSAWRVVVASVAGASHEADGTPCQDWAGCHSLPEDVLLVAVADGAGSAERSDLGARRAVEAALAALAARCDGLTTGDRAGAIRTAFAEAREALVHLAAEQGQPLAAYATTLTCLVAWRTGAVVGRVGDGFAVVEDATGGLCPVPPSRPDRGEYANETVFLTSDANDDRLETAEIEGPIRAVAVSTDGLLRLAIELTAYRPHPRFFRPLFAFAAQTDPASADVHLAAFLASDRVRARTDDDVTLVLAVLDGAVRRRDGGAEGRVDDEPAQSNDGSG